MPQLLRRLNKEGLRCFGEFLDSLKTDSPRPLPTQALTDPALSEPVSDTESVSRRTFAHQRELAEHVDDVITRAKLIDPELDAGLWTWLALIWFEDICPRDSSGKWKVGARARWIAGVNDYKTYYRHAILGPYRIFRAYRDSPGTADALLLGRVAVQSEIVEQLASRQQLAANRAVIGAATELYVNRATGAFRRGSRGKGPGSPRRLWEFWNQLDLTWDLLAVSSDELLTMLPAEFDRFRPSP